MVPFLFQSYLEDFYNFCKKQGGATADVMCEALAVRQFFITLSFFNHILDVYFFSALKKSQWKYILF